MNAVASHNLAAASAARIRCNGCQSSNEHCTDCKVQAIKPLDVVVATTGELCTAMRRWSRSTPLHSEVCTALAVMAAAIKQTSALTEKCKRSLIDQLDEMSSEVEQDFVNQRAEA